jgi:hypothetical protein
MIGVADDIARGRYSTVARIIVGTWPRIAGSDVVGIRRLMFLLVVVTGCKEPRRASDLERRVTLHCHDLSLDLRVVANRYAEIAPVLDRDPPDSYGQSVEAVFASQIGLTHETRTLRIAAIHDNLFFCDNVKKLGTKRREELGRRRRELEDKLRDQFLSDGKTLMPHVDAAKNFSELADIASELDALPLVD